MITLQERVFGVTPPSNWEKTKIRFLFRSRRGFKNVGMIEDNLLSLSYGKVIRRDIGASEGLLPESFETYQIVESGNIILRLTDLQNDKKSLRQGLVTERGIITSAYDALEVAKGNDPQFWYYNFLALDLAKYYYSLGGGVRQSIKFNDFPNDWIARPSLEIQKEVVQYIKNETKKIDRIIECVGGSRVVKNSMESSLPYLLGEKRNALIYAVMSNGSTDILPSSPNNNTDNR